IKVDQSMDSWLESGDQTIRVFRLFRYLYGSDESLILMFKNQKGNIFDEDTFRKVQKLEKFLNEKRMDQKSPLKRIKRVRSLLSADYLESKNDSLINRPFVKKIPSSKEEWTKLKKKALEEEDIRGTFFSDDFQYGALLIETDYGARVKPTSTKESSTAPKKDVSKEEATETDEADEDFSFENPPNTDQDKVRGKIIDLDKVPELESPQMEDYVVFIDELKKVLEENSFYHSVDKDSIKENSKNNLQDMVSYHMAGNPWLMGFFAKIILKEFGLIFALSMVLILGSLFYAFRSFSGMIWPSVVVITSLIWTMGFIGMSGITQTMMINILAFMVLAVGVADSIHLLSGVRYYLRQNYSHEEALLLSYKKCASSIALTTITTMAGLGSLTFSPVVPIKVFALFTALGIFFAFFMTIILLPIFLTYFPLKVKEHEKKKSHLDPIITKMNLWSKTKRKTVIIPFLLIAVALSFGIPKVFIDTNMINMVKPGYGFIESYKTIDKYFGGTASIEILLDTGKIDGVKDPQFLKSLDKLSQTIKDEWPDLVSRVYSLSKLTKKSYETLTENDKNYIIPNKKNILDQTLFSFETADPNTRKLVVDDDWQMARLTVSLVTKGSKEYNPFNDQVKLTALKIFKEYKKRNPNLKIHLTGMVPLMYKMTENISISQIQSFGIIVGVISILFFFLFKSLTLGLLALIPNLFPILVILGLTGHFGIPLDSDTLLVVPIAIGLAVDDTIHFLMHYQTLRDEGADVGTALDKSCREVGHALIYTSFVLSLGFLAFTLSASKPFTYFGILSSLSIFTALLADLFFLPPLMFWLEKKKRPLAQGELS
ncbi:MAG: MMPL family transporter, partial [Bdellovibrionota bacterium]|nr:MMPL family transporter [Bdellovibrionota bacterium]